MKLRAIEPHPSQVIMRHVNKTMPVQVPPVSENDAFVRLTTSKETAPTHKNLAVNQLRRLQLLAGAAGPAKRLSQLQVIADRFIEGHSIETASGRKNNDWSTPPQCSGVYSYLANIAPHAVVQRKTAIQVFNGVLNKIAAEIKITNDKLAKILLEIAQIPNLDSENDEQNILFRTAWRGKPGETLEAGDDRRMYENLIQADYYGIGRELRDSRISSDKDTFLTSKSETGQEVLYDAFRNALFFRAERKDSHATKNGRLNYDSQKHGKKGSASVSPSDTARFVMERADTYLFVSKRYNEALEYAAKAQGGDREVLTIIASRAEVGQMQYDVDSFGYKTKEPLTGIVSKEMTPTALENLNSWLAVSVDLDTANRVLSRFRG